MPCKWGTMVNKIHRDGDDRACGATTDTLQNKEVYAEGELVSIDGDPNSHGEGGLIAATKNVYINDTLVVNLGDAANPDGLCAADIHCAPNATSGANTVFVGDPL